MKNSKKSEQRIQNQFGAFCTRVLKNETRYIQRELGNKAIKEKNRMTSFPKKTSTNWQRMTTILTTNIPLMFREKK